MKGLECWKGTQGLVWLELSVSGSLGVRVLPGKTWLMALNADGMRMDNQLVLVYLDLASSSTIRVPSILTEQDQGSLSKD